MFTEDGADNGSMRFRVHQVLSLAAFDAAIGAVIVLNSIVIGLESQTELYGGNTVTYQRMEHVFLFIYTLELAMRFYAYGLACFRNSWVIFDLIVVTLGLFSWLFIRPSWERGWSGAGRPNIWRVRSRLYRSRFCNQIFVGKLSPRSTRCTLLHRLNPIWEP